MVRVEYPIKDIAYVPDEPPPWRTKADIPDIFVKSLTSLFLFAIMILDINRRLKFLLSSYQIIGVDFKSLHRSE